MKTKTKEAIPEEFWKPCGGNGPGYYMKGETTDKFTWKGQILGRKIRQGVALIECEDGQKRIDLIDLCECLEYVVGYAYDEAGNPIGGMRHRDIATIEERVWTTTKRGRGPTVRLSLALKAIKKAITKTVRRDDTGCKIAEKLYDWVANVRAEEDMDSR